MSAKTKQIVLVEWEDSIVQGGWRSMEQAEKVEASTCYTAGVLIEKNSKHVIIGQSWYPAADDVSNTTQIPRGMVRSIKRIGSFKP